MSGIDKKYKDNFNLLFQNLEAVKTSATEIKENEEDIEDINGKLEVIAKDINVIKNVLLQLWMSVYDEN